MSHAIRIAPVCEQATPEAPPVHDEDASSLGLPPGVLATDTATCYDCPDGVGYPSADGWTCPDCGARWAYDEDV